MSIEWFRDLAVIILGLAGTITVIFIGILVFVLYRKISPLLNSAQKTAKTMENLSTCVEEEVARPLAQVVAFVQGINQAVNLCGRFFMRKEGGRHE
ncbi:hypothetical protein ACFLWN_01785 [Chloroflexota bacterium]